MDRNFKPIKTAPKGGGAEFTSDQNWSDPPHDIIALL